MLRSITLYLVFLASDNEHWALLQLRLHVYLIKVLLALSEVKLSTVTLTVIHCLQALINHLCQVLQ